MYHETRIFNWSALLVSCALLLGCGGNSSKEVDSSPTPSVPDFSLDVTESANIQPATSGSVVINVTRSNGHQASITLSLVENDQGISGTGTIANGATSGTMFISVPESVTASSYDLRVEGNDGTVTHLSSFTQIVTPIPDELVISSNSQLAIASVNSVYQLGLMARGGATPYSWSLHSGNLPPAFTLSTAGSLNGTAAAAGSYAFTVQVTDNDGTITTKTLALNVNDALLPELEVNGSFEQGLNQWSTVGAASGVQYSLVADAIEGVAGVRVSGRTQATDTPRQNVFSSTLAMASGTPVTTHFWIKLDDLAMVRCKLSLTSDIGSGQTATSTLILAEQVLRTSGVWVEVSGTQTIAWDGVLTSASVYFDIGQPVEGVFPGFTLDHLQIQRDADLDGLADADESGAEGNNSDGNNPDRDNDGLPDGWEMEYQLADLLNPDVADASLDADDDGFTNDQEYWAATDPLSSTSVPGVSSVSDASEQVIALTKYLALLPSQDLNRVISGQHLTGSASQGGLTGEFASNMQALFDQTGKWPGILSLQYEGADSNGSPLQVSSVNSLAIDWAAAGGLVLIKFQPFNPWTLAASGSAGGPEVDLIGLLDPDAGDPAKLIANTAANTVWLDWLDQMATGLEQLQQAGITVLWRPLSEMNNGSHWQSRQPRTAWIALWRHMHDYFSQQRGLKNLIWVYESDSVAHFTVAADYYYPGDDVIDIMGHNLYDDDWVLPYDLNALFRRYPKIYGFPQAGSQSVRDGSWDNLIISNGLRHSFPRASLFCNWNDFYSGGNVLQVRSIVSQSNATALLDDAWVITREELSW